MNINKKLVAVGVTSLALAAAISIPVFAETFNGNGSEAACKAKYSDCMQTGPNRWEGNILLNGGGNTGGTGSWKDSKEACEAHFGETCVPNPNKPGEWEKGKSALDNNDNINNRNQCERAGGVWYGIGGSNGNGECKLSLVNPQDNDIDPKDTKITERKPAKTAVY